MLLAVDIGNTNITVGLIKRRRIVEKYNIKSGLPKRQIGERIKGIERGLRRKKINIQACIVCSVVPTLTGYVSKKFKTTFEVDTKIVGKNIKVPIKNKYEKPKQVGIDRLVGAYAAKKLFGSPVIIVDFGTAITIDVVDHKGDYEGGIIIPGIRLSAESLFLKTALLPNIHNIRRPKKIVGKSTEESILSGIFYGYGAMCTGLIQTLKDKPYGKLKRKALKRAKIILTGGYTDIMKQYITVKIDKIEQDLVLLGILYLHSENL